MALPPRGDFELSRDSLIWLQGSQGIKAPARPWARLVELMFLLG